MNILIVEDEMLVAGDLAETLKKQGFPNSVIATNYSEAVAVLQSQPVHLALLDIHLGGYKTGIDVAQFIRAQVSIPFIFLTAYEDLQTVNKAVALAPHAYLQKPFSTATLYAALQLAVQNFKKGEGGEAGEDDGVLIRDAFFVKEKHSYVRLPLAQIHYLHSEGNYIEVFTARKKHLIRTSQKALLGQLPPAFAKVHKSYVVNCNLITAIGTDTVCVDAQTLPLGAPYRAELLKKVQKFS